jgi:alpha-mannosidase
VNPLELSPLVRRAFLRESAKALGGAAALSAGLSRAALAAVLDLPSVPRAPGNNKVLHLIGYSHIDAAWLWPWRDGSNEACDTMQAATDRMDETSDFKYSHSSAAHWRWVEKSDPRLFAIVKRRVAEKRMEVINGWIVEPDCNLPSGESFIRHALYGQRYFREHVGATAVVGANPDSFGHSGGLPQILLKSGLKYYCFMRPQENEMKLPLVFWWESPDGSRVLVGRIHNDYDADPKIIAERHDDRTDTIVRGVDEYFETGLDHAMFWFGVGDHGGGVTKKYIETILELKKNPTLPELRFSTLESFFVAVEQSAGAASLPVVKTELQHHSRGCYSAHGEGKALNRRAERSLGQAETVAAIAKLAAAHEYPTVAFAESWWKVLFCQFHDMMAGTSLYNDYQDVRDSVGSACDVAKATLVESLQVLARVVDTSSVPESCVFAYNPLPWARTANLEYHTDGDPTDAGSIYTHLKAKDGTTVPIQWRPADTMTNFVPKLSARVELPPGGYRVFTLERGDIAVPPMAAGVAVSDREVGIPSLPVVAHGREMLYEPIGLVVIDDRSDTWSHDVVSFRNVIGRPAWVTTVVVENGPITRVTRQIATWRTSTIYLDVIERAGLDAIELKFVIDWHEHEQILKLEIPTAIMEPQVFAKVAGATIVATSTGSEEPAQDYVAVQGTLGGQVVSLGLCNAQTYSYDVLATPNGALLRTILIRSAPFARHRPAVVPANDNNAWQDQGRQERSFWIVRGAGPYTALGLERRAQELQTPAEYVADSRHPGTEPWERTYFAVTPRNVVATAIKQGEDGDALIVRLQETTGEATKATLESGAFGWSFGVALKPWEIKTVAIRAAGTKSASVADIGFLES